MLKTLVGFLAGALVACLGAVLGLAIWLDALSPDHSLHVGSARPTDEGRMVVERFAQFTNHPGELMFGFKSQERQPGMSESFLSPLSIWLQRMSGEELEARAEHLRTAEGQSRSGFILGVSRMVAEPEGQNFRGDYVTVKFWLIYGTCGFLAAMVVLCWWLIVRRIDGNSDIWAG